MLIAGLIIAALACLVVGLVIGESILAYVALGLSLVGIAVLAAVMFRSRRTETTEDQEEKAPAEGETGEPSADSATTADDRADERVDDRVGNADDDSEHVVYVVPGRKRYHEAGCRLLTDFDHEELTVGEARDERFTPCTVCIADRSGLEADDQRSTAADRR